MKHFKKILTFALVIGLLFAGTTQVSFATELSATQLQSLLQEAVDEEYLAKNTYQAILDAHGDIRPFNRIIRSEQMHIDAVKKVAENHGFELTEPKSTVVAPKSIEESYARGLEIEKADVTELRELLKKNLPEDVKTTLNYLLKGSENHLRAFTRMTEGTGVPGGRGAGRGTFAPGQMVDENDDGICDLTGKEIGTMFGRRGMRGTGMGGKTQMIDENGDGVCDTCGREPGSFDFGPKTQ